MEDKLNLLVDANFNTNSLEGYWDTVYTDKFTAEEKSGVFFYKTLSEDHILTSYMRLDFEKNGGSITLRAFDTYGPEAEVYYFPNTGGEIVYCGSCNGPTLGFLTTNDGVSHYVCHTLFYKSGADFSLLVRVTAFSDIFQLMTNDQCLKWSSDSSGPSLLFKQEKWHIYHV